MFTGGSTNTAQALKDAHSKMFTVQSGARPDISNVKLFFEYDFHLS